MAVGMNGFRHCAERLLERRQPLIRICPIDGCGVKVVMGDEGVSRTIFAVTALIALRESPPLRQPVRYVKGDHSQQNGDEKQRRYENE